MRRARATGRRTSAQQSGGSAEEQAARFLEREGLEVIARNYRTRLGEIDLVARDRGTLVFVEVRLRSSARFGGAAASITPAKRRRVELAARLFLSRLDPLPPCRFDVVALEGGRAQWLKGAFEAMAG